MLNTWLFCTAGSCLRFVFRGCGCGALGTGWLVLLFQTGLHIDFMKLQRVEGRKHSKIAALLPHRLSNMLVAGWSAKVLQRNVLNWLAVWMVLMHSWKTSALCR